MIVFFNGQFSQYISLFWVFSPSLQFQKHDYCKPDKGINLFAGKENRHIEVGCLKEHIPTF
ncbi:hypothetical protein KSI01_20670 [Kurthia sibirica]|nr:hypothetical protein KSI01_20670 [Kurthia sibirica]